MQACYNWCEKLDGVLHDAGDVPFDTELRSFSLVWRNEAGKMTNTFSHAHVDDLKLIGEDAPFLMINLEERIKMTWKGFQPKTFCGLQYAYGADHEIFVHMKYTAHSLSELFEAIGSTSKI
jgi:hypothetical protein